MKCPFEGCNFNRSLQSGIGEHFYDKHELDCCKHLGELIEKIEARIKELKQDEETMKEDCISWEPYRLAIVVLEDLLK